MYCECAWTSLNYICLDASQEAIWTSSDSNNFDTRFPTIDRWIRQCLNHHGSCAHSTTPLLPKRILDVGTEDQNIMRLIASGDRRAHYIALSHCWGTAAPLTTTKATLSSRMSRIEMSDLPKLFQETVRVVRHLRIRYLWIDTLSIIQDDTQDWETEAAKMCQIYQDAFLTIAASAAEDCNSELICPFVPSSQGTYLNEDPLRFAVRVSDIHSPKYLEPLDTRGWALQEDLLSRRMLYFGDGQFSWHCREVIASEDGLLDGLDVGDSMLSRMRQNFRKVSNAEKREVQLIWRRLVEAYSVRDLTFRSDKLSALAGLTVFFQNLLGEAPILGLWRDDIFAGLLWTTEHGATRPSSPLSQDISSWSWMSIDGHVSYDDPWTWSTGDPANTTQKFRTVPAAEVHSSPVQWSGQPLSSRPLPNSLTVHGSLMLVSLTYHDYLRSKRSVKIRVDNNSKTIHEAAKGWGTLDVPIDALPQDAHCLHVADVIPQADDSISDGSHMGLLVRPVGQKPNTYSRIGLLGLDILCEGQSQGDRANNVLPFSTKFPEAKAVTITLV